MAPRRLYIVKMIAVFDGIVNYFPACYNEIMGAIIAMDIGGTQIRVAAYSREDTKPLNILKTKTRARDGDIYDYVVAQIQAILPTGKVEAISVAIPGPVDPQTGSIIETPNIPGWNDFPLGEKLTRQFGLPVFVGNDANCAALGEWRFGTGKGHHDLLYLTVSTGIGGGVISNDQLVLGSRGLATELGHVTVLPGGPVCSCGQSGHLEAVASGPGIVRFFQEQISAGKTSRLSPGSNLTARDIAEAASQGDELARAAFAQAGEYLGQALADYLHIFNPSIIILGGGVSQSGALILEPARESMKRHVMNPSYLTGLELAFAKLGDDAGLLGALAQAQLKLAGN